MAKHIDINRPCIWAIFINFKVIKFLLDLHYTFYCGLKLFIAVLGAGFSLLLRCRIFSSNI